MKQVNNRMETKLPKDDKDLFKLRVEIVKPVSPDCIYVYLKAHRESYEIMQKNMTEFYSNCDFKGKSDTLEVGATYAVFSKKDGDYLRGKILEIKDDEIRVFFVDDSVEETVSCAEIFPLHDNFVNEPIQVFKIKLVGITPCCGVNDWLSTTCAKLKEIIQNHSTSKFYISKVVR